MNAQETERYSRIIHYQKDIHMSLLHERTMHSKIVIRLFFLFQFLAFGTSATGVDNDLSWFFYTNSVNNQTNIVSRSINSFSTNTHNGKFDSRYGTNWILIDTVDGIRFILYIKEIAFDDHVFVTNPSPISGRPIIESVDGEKILYVQFGYPTNCLKGFVEISKKTRLEIPINNMYDVGGGEGILMSYFYYFGRKFFSLYIEKPFGGSFIFEIKSEKIDFLGKFTP
jgi:hypothetical protein